MINVSLRQLRAFVAVVRTGSFTHAAESLFLTQSALSGLVKELESSLGVVLIERSTRKVNLSDIGREVYPLISKMLSDLDETLHQISEHRELSQGTVRVAAPQLMASTLLPEVIAAYKVNHPEIVVRLVDCMVEGVTSKVFSGEVDFGIGPERDESSDIKALTLFELPFVLALPPDHKLAKGRTIKWSALSGYPVISLQGQFTERLSVDLRGSVKDLNMSLFNEVAFMSTALSMVNSGLGMAICNSYAQSLVKLYQLEMRPLVDPVVTRRFFVFTKMGKSLTPAAESFHAFLTDFVERYPFMRTSDIRVRRSGLTSTA